MEELIRVLHLPYTLSKKSGIMSFIMNYYRFIDRNKVQFDFLCFEDDNNTYQEEIEKLGGNVYLFPLALKNNPLKLRNEIEKFFRNHGNKYSIVHYHAISIWVIALEIASTIGLKIITHCHNTKYSDKLLGSIRNRLLCSTIKKYTNYYFACSNDAGRFLFGDNNVKNNKVTIINNAIISRKFYYNEDIRNNIRKKLDLDKNFVIGHIGRFSKQKNHNFLIEIFREINYIDPSAKLLLVGNGELLPEIKQKVKKFGLNDKIIFLGHRDDIAEIIQAMDVFVLPSKFEGLGIVLIEAQYSNLPCVVSSVVPNEAKISNKFYKVSLNQEPIEWAKAILNYKLEDRRSDYIECLDAGYDIQTEVKKLEEIYSNIRREV